VVALINLVATVHVWKRKARVDLIERIGTATTPEHSLVRRRPQCAQHLLSPFLCISVRALGECQV